MTVELIDTHCHLTSGDLYAHRARVIEAAHAAGVVQMITVACRAEEAQVALSLRAEFPSVFVAAGIHPHEASRIDPDEIERVAATWSHRGVVAAGEMGLDYHYDFSPRDVQQQVFRRQLELASPTALPLVIHCREAQDDVVHLLVEHGYRDRKVVFHCFSGTAEEAAQIRDHGWRTSFTGLITFKNASGPQQAWLDTPVDQLMLETDSPYLSPEPVRKMRPNEPQNVAHTARFGAMLRGMTFEKLAEITTNNARDFFGL